MTKQRILNLFLGMIAKEKISFQTFSCLSQKTIILIIIILSILLYTGDVISDLVAVKRDMETRHLDVVGNQLATRIILTSQNVLITVCFTKLLTIMAFKVCLKFPKFAMNLAILLHSCQSKYELQKKVVNFIWSNQFRSCAQSWRHPFFVW